MSKQALVKNHRIERSDVIFEVGRFAEQANAAVLAHGDTMVLATVVASPRNDT